ncbi:NUDIX domain-containing protein [Candidatus Bipolaricaulota bacterium]|nr:NUDIX domain-containing protein [Candidatus Bipolaricaulota bacterium]
MKWTFPNELEEDEERAAGFVLFRTLHQQRQYLLLRHRNGGHWAFPKGRLEPDENEIEAALRETFEETGISQLFPIARFCETTSYTVRLNGQEKAKTVAYFLAETRECNVVLSAEHIDYQWLDFTQAAATLTFDNSRDILMKADALLEASGEREHGHPQ